MTESTADERMLTIVSDKNVSVNQPGWHNQISLMADKPRTLSAAKAYACLQAHACVSEVRDDKPAAKPAKVDKPVVDKPAE